MASKAQVFNDLIINKDEGLDVCIWKLMADRVGRTKSEIADELLPHGFPRKMVENRAESLMRGGKWFERDEFKSRNVTKYILKRECRMPEVETGSTPEQQEKTEERGMHRRQQSPMKLAMQQALEKALKTNEQQQQTELPITQVQADVQPEETPKKAMPVLDLANGLTTTIHDAMCDFKEYTKDDICLLLEAIGANPGTVRIRMSGLASEGWFDIREGKVGGKTVIYYSLKGTILRPVDEKPYRAQVRKQGEPVKADDKKQENNAGSASMFTEEEISKVITAIESDTHEGAKFAAGHIAYDFLKTFFEGILNCMLKDESAQALLDAMVKRGVLKIEEENADPTKIVYRLSKSIHTDQPIAKVGEGETIVLPAGALDKLLEAGEPGVINLGEGNAKTGMPEEVPIDPIEQLGNLDKDKLTQFAGSDLPVNMQVTDLELELFQTLAAYAGEKPFSDVRATLNSRGYDDEEIDQVFTANLGYFFKGDGDTYTVPKQLATKTITKERIVDFKNRYEKVKVEMSDESKQRKDDEARKAQAKVREQAARISKEHGVDHSIWRLVNNGKVHYLSDIVNPLVTEGFNETQVRDRIMELGSAKYGWLMTANSMFGMTFKLAEGAEVPSPGGVVTPYQKKVKLPVEQGFLRCVFTLMQTFGPMPRTAMEHHLMMAGFPSTMVTTVVGRLVREQDFITMYENGIVGLVKNWTAPTLPVEPSMLKVEDGIDRNVWLLMADRNWHDFHSLLQVMDRVGHDSTRVADRLRKLADRDGWLEHDILCGVECLRMKASAVMPPVPQPREEERRGASYNTTAPTKGTIYGGLPQGVTGYALELNGRFGGKPVEEIPAVQSNKLLRYSATIGGIPLTLKQLVKLAAMLRARGYGRLDYQAPVASADDILQATYRIGDREFSDEQLNALALELNEELPGQQ